MLAIFLGCLPLQAQQDTSVAEVKKAIETFFEGFHKGDTVLMKSTMHKDLTLQTIYRTKEGKDVLNKGDAAKFVNAIGTRLDSQKWLEKLLDIEVQVDANMAHAWTPYEFYLNDTFSHCGVNSFQLMNDSGVWKIIYLVDTRRRAGCRE